jgi:hypothetical protein
VGEFSAREMAEYASVLVDHIHVAESGIFEELVDDHFDAVLMRRRYRCDGMSP